MNNKFHLGIILSACLHISVVVLLYFGMPESTKDSLEIWQPIPIEVVPVAELTTAPALQVEEIEEEAPQEDHPEKPMPLESNPEPAENPTSSAPEPPVEAAVEEESKPVPVPPKLRADAKHAIIPEPRRKPKQPKIKPTLAKQDIKSKEPTDDFTSVLKNLQKNVGQAAKSKEKGSSNKPTTGTISDILSVSELDALRQQISQCWNIPVGAQNIEDLVIDIRVAVNPDRTVKNAHIIDQNLVGRGLNYRTAAESALRAVLHPNCSPLKLPQNKFEEWRVFTFRFNPKDFL